MIPILYETTATTFTTNGLGRLDDLIDCTVTEERNGEFYLIATIPITSAMYSKIAMSRIIFATAHDGDSGQAFRISKISKPFDGKVEIEAQHISYQLSWIPLIPFSASSCAETISSIVTNSAESNPFTFWTDIESTSSFSFDTPASVRNKLGGTEGSILSVYGGEYEFDNYTVKLHSARGEDKGVTLRYGKNITDISQEENLENTYTGIVPYWQSDDVLVTVDGYVVESEYAENYPFNRTKIVDFSSDFDEQPTQAQLLSAAQSYIARNCVGVPNVSIDVSFVSLAQTEEYKDIANLERVNLCDTVTVIFDKLNIAVSAKVVKTEYDVLNERYNEITIGTIDASLATTINGIDTSIETTAQQTKSAYQKAINNATEQITGANGGVIQTHYDANNQPYEMTIADNAVLGSASNVWRWNIGGLGFSSTGYDGTYTTAITADGQIVADFITTGTLDANVIRAGIIQNADDDSTYWNLETGDFKATNGTFVNADVQTSDGTTYLNLSNGGIAGGVGSTKYADINMASTIDDEPALAIRADSTLIAGGLYTATDKDATSFSQGVTKTFSNVASDITCSWETLSNIVYNMSVNVGNIPKCCHNLESESSYYSNIVSDLAVNGSTWSWTNNAISIPSLAWLETNFYFVDSVTWSKYTLSHLNGLTWTDNTMVFVNGLLV